MEIFELSAIVGGFLGALVVFLLGNYTLLARLSALESRVLSIANTSAANKGRENFAIAQERMETAIAEAMQLYQQGKAPEEILKEIGVKYPDVAVRLAKKHIFG